MLRIRAHHFLCMQGFQGYGYNREFTDNMQRIIEEIKSAPDLEAEIISRCDEICSCCPHNSGGICKKKPCSEEESKDMDLSIMRHLDIEEGSRMKVKSIFNLVNTKLKSSSEVQVVCGCCEWKERCLWFTSRKQ